MQRINPSARRDAYGKTINRDHSSLLAYGIPWITILLGSMSPMAPIIPTVPVLPPLGFLFLIGWRTLRPGLLPLWAGFPLGLFDDLFSGQPFGCGILLFSAALIAIDLLEVRFPWRGFWQNWLTASLFTAIYLFFCVMASGANPSLLHAVVLVPQLLLSIVLFPIIASMVSLLDRVRLLRIRRIG